MFVSSYFTPFIIIESNDRAPTRIIHKQRVMTENCRQWVKTAENYEKWKSGEDCKVH